MATTTNETEEHLSLKLIVNEESNKVLFAEAGKDFVDVLFSFLTFPLGTIARLVEKDSNTGPVTVGCLNTLYRSVKDLDESYLWDETVKQMLLQPSNFAEDYCNTLKLNIDDTPPTMFYQCSNPCVRCRSLGLTTSRYPKQCTCGKSFYSTSSVLAKHFRKGFVNGIVTFVITDNLAVMPNSMDCTSLGMLQEFGILNPSSAKEIVLNLNKQKVLELLKCFLISKSTLTDLFLEKKPSPGISSLFPLAEFRGKGNVQIIIKLVIKKSDGKVLYAQGKQDFANLLLSFLTFPLGGVVSVLGTYSCLGSIDVLYKSIADLNENNYFVSKEAKNRLIHPCISPKLKLSNQILPILDPGVVEYYSHGGLIGRHLQYFKAGEDKSRESYVKGPAMYYATDDLVVAPLSPISNLGLLNRFKIPLNDLKEKIVTIGVTDCLRILKASLTSTSALTNGLAHLLTDVKGER
ncbi:uncharacterized protein [Cicer arietinum]|uniref:Uncharacterized protein LOC101501027 n=1 Tax=Cicer arietinum TaxID=3827 RepID=A0A1S2XND6_CICAR|nr:uncharacterized protein LOC101501027 [Cicer arietinum]